MNNIIVAARSDGFGERMCSMLNAMYIAKKTGWDFKFVWQDPPKLENDNKNILLPWNDMLPQELMFSQDFINKYALNKTFPECLSIIHQFNSLKELARNPKQYEWMCGHYSFQLPLTDFLGDINSKEYANILKESWKQIEFSQGIQHIITQTQQIQNLPNNFVAIHIRCGDILYHFSTEYEAKDKAISIYLAINIIEEEIKNNNFIVLFSDDLNLTPIAKQQINKKFGNKVFIIDDFFEREKYTQLEQSIFEIMVMSQATKIYSGISGFSRLANMIGNNQHIIIPSFFNLQTKYKIILQNIEQYDFPNIHKAFGYMHLFDLAKELSYSPEIQNKFIQQSIALNSKSIAYKLLFIYTSLLIKDLQQANKELKDIHSNFIDEEKFLDELFRPFWLLDGLFYHFVFKNYFINPQLYQSYPYIAYFTHRIAIRLQDSLLTNQSLFFQRNYKSYFTIMLYISNSNNMKLCHLAAKQIDKTLLPITIIHKRPYWILRYIKCTLLEKQAKLKRSCQKRLKTLKKIKRYFIFS